MVHEETLMREYRGVFWMSEESGDCCLHVNPRSTNNEKRGSLTAVISIICGLA
jgi:hypothetical protein